MPESQNEQLENAVNTIGPQDAGDAALRYEAGFYGLKKLVIKSGVTAVEAAKRILQVSSTLVTSYSVDDLAKTLSTAEELNASKPVYHSFDVWLTRAREKGIEYRHSLDWAVTQYGSWTPKLGAVPRVQPPETSDAPQKDEPPVAKVDECEEVVGLPVQAEIPATFRTPEKGEPAVTALTPVKRSTKRRPSKAFLDALKKMLDEIDVKVKEKGEKIDFKAMPGKCANLHDLARRTKYFPTLTPARGCPEFCVNGVLVKGCSSGLRTGW